MTAPGLFPEPERVELPVGPWARSVAGWSYGFFGEDGVLVIAGWAPADAVAEVFQAAGIDFDPRDYQPLHMWARELAACPEHAVKAGDCQLCQEIKPGDPWLEWGAQGEDPDGWAGEPGYFRVTVIDLEG